MSYLEMKAELAEAIPGMSRIYAGTLINRAWRVVRDCNLWSFQLKIGGFSTPGIITAGTVITPQFPSPPTIIGDLTASLAWYNQFLPPLTQFQFRVGDYNIYNIIKVDFTNFSPGNFALHQPASGYAILTLDRPFIDPIQPGPGYGQGGYGQGGYGGSPGPQAYQILQAYYPAPSKTFKRWLSVQDMVNGYALGVWTERRDVNWADPQRQLTSDPVVIMGIGQDTRPNTATPGWQVFELWPTPESQISYMTFYVDRGADLVLNSDELPEPITQDVVLTKARTYAYEWAEARKDVMAAKGSGANYLNLKKVAEDEFLARVKTLRLEDKDVVDAFKTRMQNDVAGFAINPWYNTVTNRAGMGWPIGLI